MGKGCSLLSSMRRRRVFTQPDGETKRVMQGWDSFFVAEAGAAAALAGLVFVAVSINLARILEFPTLPTRVLEALVALLSVLTAALFSLIPFQSARTYGAEIAGLGLF